MRRLVEKIVIAAVPLQTCGNILCDVSVTDQLTSGERLLLPPLVICVNRWQSQQLTRQHLKQSLFIVWGIDITELKFDNWFWNQILLRRIRNQYRPITISNTSTCATELHKYDMNNLTCKGETRKACLFH